MAMEHLDAVVAAYEKLTERAAAGDCRCKSAERHMDSLYAELSHHQNAERYLLQQIADLENAIVEEMAKVS